MVTWLRTTLTCDELAVEVAELLTLTPFPMSSLAGPVGTKVVPFTVMAPVVIDCVFTCVIDDPELPSPAAAAPPFAATATAGVATAGIAV